MIRPYTLPALLTSSFLFFTSSAFSQTWQWAVSGGGTDDGFNLGAGYDRVDDITTDAHGNVYVLARANGAAAQVDGHAIDAYNGEVVLSSFRCDGTFRWARTLGTPAGVDFGRRIGTDGEDGVYVGALLWYNQGSIGADTSWSWISLGTFVMKFDTTGAFQWLRSPEPTTFSTLPQNYPMDMDIDEAGNTYLLCAIEDTGAYGDGTVMIDEPGVHVFKYDRAGVFQGDITLPMTVDGIHSRSVYMKRDPSSGRFILCGWRYMVNGVTIDGQEVTHPLYVASFDPQGGLLWERENTIDFANGFNARPAIDEQGNIYLAGASSQGDDFLGYTYVNTLTGIPHTGPMIVKLNAAGQLQWGINGSTNASTNSKSVVLSGNEVVVSGEYPGALSFPGEQEPLAHMPNQGYDIFTARFSRQTGAFLRIDTIPSPYGMDEEVGATTTDGQGNLYIGGSFGNAVIIAGQDVFSSGGDRDFLVAKFGTSSCSTTLGISDAVPLPTFQLFPVPATDRVTVKGARTGQRLVIQDALGRVVHEEILRTDDPVIDIAAFAHGTYLVQVMGSRDTGVATRILLKP